MGWHHCLTICYSLVLIRSFRHKGLKELFETGQSRRVRQDQQARIVRLMDVLNSASRPEDMNLPGFYFHRLRARPVRYSVRVTGNWRLTFAWSESDAINVNLEGYH